MKIWVDILTPKQLVFFEPLIDKLKKNHKLLCTSRDYGEVKNLAKIRNFDVKVIGKFGGKSKSGKLLANLERMNKLFGMVAKFDPDLTISFCSPDASRISFGLGIKHVAYCDSPHANAVMRLTSFNSKITSPLDYSKKRICKIWNRYKKYFALQSNRCFNYIKTQIS